MDLREQALQTSSHRHPWELARAAVVRSVLPADLPSRVVADIGAGDLFFAGIVQAIGCRRFYAIDSGYADTENTGQFARSPSLAVVPDQSLDLVLLMDVLEHVDDEGGFLQQIRPKMRPGSTLLVTVPAFQFLFSDHDRFLQHHRRYDFSRLESVLTREGFVVERSFYFFASLLPLRLLKKLLELLRRPRTQQEKGISQWGQPANSWITRSVVGSLRFDAWICRILASSGFKLPGLSLCALCKKP